MRILITGGNGFIGHHIVKRFLKEGYEVVVLVREKSNLENLKDCNVEYHYGDIRDYESIEEAFKNVQGLVHVSALAKDWGNYKDFYETNVVGVINVLKLSKKYNLKKIVLTGTNSVYGEENSELVKNEKSPMSSHYKYFGDKIIPCKMNYYRDSKKAGKVEAIKYAKENKLTITFVEPVWVYGEGELTGGFYEYIKSAKEKIPFLPGSSKNNFHIIYAKDLAEIFYRAFEKQSIGIESYLAGNVKVDKMDEIYKKFCIEANVNKPKNLPKFIAYPIGFLLELLYTIFRMKNPPVLTRARVNMFYDNIEYSVDKLKDELDYIEFTPLELGIKQTVQWYKENGYL